MTRAECVENGYLICLEAEDPNVAHHWDLFNVTTTVENFIEDQDGQQVCFAVTNATTDDFAIYHYQDGNLCDRNAFSVTCSDNCPEEIFNYTVDDQSCLSLEVEFSPVVAVNNIWPIAIDFGDGSPVTIIDDFTSPITHEYANEGSYDVCFTYSAFFGSDLNYITCCYPIDIEFPEDCTCADNLITKCDQNCEEVVLCVNNPDINAPFTIDFGDGSTQISTSDFEITHTFPAEGTYDVCITYDVLDIQLECCYPINVILQCCNSADFSFTQEDLSNSCVNPQFSISPVCDDRLPNKHKWIFSDGKEFDTPYPPIPYTFTDFVNTNGEVCVTHEIECCGNVQSVTKCLPHIEGAYIGLPGEERFMTDVLPTGQTIYDICQAYSVDPQIPLIIDCILVNDRNSFFLTPEGVFNFGNDAGLRNEKVLYFISDTLQSAFKIGFDDCCVWRGIDHQGYTVTDLESTTVTQAQAALHYPARTSGTPPQLRVDNSHFDGVNFVVKSNQQHVNIASFHGNDMIGYHQGESCSCGGVNAIDFRNIPSGFTEVFAAGAENKISKFEQGFHFDNAALEAYDFFIEGLHEYPNTGFFDNPSTNDAAVGIDFRWSRASNSSLTFDDFRFKDLMDSNADGAGNQAVDIYVTNGFIDVDAAADAFGSINTLNVATSYEINVEGVGSGNNMTIGSIGGIIKDNDLRSENNGINMVFRNGASNNSFDIISNYVEVDGNQVVSSGITVSSPWPPSTQDIDITFNEIDTDDGASNGYNIYINATEGMLVNENIINPSSAHGIYINQGGNSDYWCNDITDVAHGIYVNQSQFNNIEDNKVDFPTLGLSFHGADNTGTYIAGNEFNQSNYEDITYEAASITGQQHHNKYNSWINHNQQGIPEVKHDGTPAQATFCQFYVPDGAVIPSEHRPIFNQADLELEDFGTKDDSETCIHDVFDPNGGGFLTNPDDPDMVNMMSSLVNGGMDEAGFTAAQKAAWEQSIYQYLLDYPAIAANDPVLHHFLLQAPASFTGQSMDIERLFDDIQVLTDNHQQSIAGIRLEIDNKRTEISDLMPQLCLADDNVNSQVEAQINLLLSEIDSLESVMDQQASVLQVDIEAKFSQIQGKNSQLSQTEEHEWNEYFINELTIQRQLGQELSESQLNSLRNIAASCFADGGRAVYTARGILWNDYNEYYDAEGCVPASARQANVETQLPKVTVAPNPAMDKIKLRWDTELTGKSVHIVVTDLNGKVVYQQNEFESNNGFIQINTANWLSGVYFVQLRGENTLNRAKVVIQQ